MCLTNEGNAGPIEKLCGFHGTCLQNICICDDGWSNSFEFMPTLFTNEGARELYNNISNFGGKELRLSEFKRELLNRSPCSRHDNTMYTLYAVSLIICCVAIVAGFYHLSVTKKREEGTYPFFLSFIAFIVGALMKLISLDNVFPFNFIFSLSNILFAFVHGLVTNSFFLKYTKYHLRKGKLNFGLQVKIYGRNADGIFKVQPRFLLTLHVLSCILSLAFPVFTVMGLKFQEELNFEMLVFSQEMFILFIYYTIFLLSHLAFSELAKDYFKLSNLSDNTKIDETTKKKNELLLSLSIKIIGLRNRILSYQYFIVIQVGCIWPLICIFALDSIPKCSKISKTHEKHTSTGESSIKISL
eukprot:snap_masked-scaffold_8-processed-gene-9.50-mRNA-1 protein AED:1.00 eAED:1.00 QI:0/0/0/0/1/1/4/0/356